MDEREIVLTIRDFKEILNQLLRQIDALEERLKFWSRKIIDFSQILSYNMYVRLREERNFPLYQTTDGNLD